MLDFTEAMVLALVRSSAVGCFNSRMFQLPMLWVDRLRENLPKDLYRYRPIEHVDAIEQDGTSTRWVLPIDRLGGTFWPAISLAMHSIALQRAVFSSLDVSPRGYPRVALIRDLPGYKIRVHADSPRKLATLQLYLAVDNSKPHIGVRFYREIGVEQYDECGQVGYLPGVGYCFEVTPFSWHGVNKTELSDGIRDSLMVVYYRDSTEQGYD